MPLRSRGALVAILLVGCATSPPATTAAPTTVVTTTPSTVSPAPTTSVPVYTPGSPLPQVVTASYFPVELVQRVSRFRSGFGHDNSDDFESCRSMKHYFVADQTFDHTTIEIRAPFDGEVVETRVERLQNGGTQLTIRSSAAPAFYAILFHVTTTVKVGDTLTSGELVGHHVGNFTASDIAIFADLGDNRRQLVSAFELMTDEIFEQFRLRGAVSREQFIIPVAERDAAPLTCDEFGGFADQGSIENWVELDG